MRATDWIGRVTVLVLSTLATFSIIASLVSVSTPTMPAPRPNGAVQIDVPPPEHSSATSASEPGAPPTTSSGSLATASGQEDDERGSRDIAKWLRALTYAVLGLAGFIAVLAIVAMRATAHLGAIADRR
jgi:hypothetical protein